MPATEARDARYFVSMRDEGLVESGLGRMFERYDFKALVIEHCAVADELRLRNTRDSLEVDAGWTWLVFLVLLFPCPYDSDVGPNACGRRE